MIKNIQKRRRDAWFVPIRGSYLPNNIKGWLTYIPYLAFLLATAAGAFVATDSNILAVLLIVPNWLAATAALTYIAVRKS